MIKMIMAIYDLDQSFCFKQTQDLVYKIRHTLQGHSKGIHFFIFNLNTSRLSSCLSSNGTKFQFRPRKDCDSVPW